MPRLPVRRRLLDASLVCVLASTSCAATDLGGVAINRTDASSLADSSNDVAIDASLPPCKHDYDCYGLQTCQSGKCCQGKLTNGVCRCGATVNCDLQHVCCWEEVCPYDDSASHPTQCLARCPTCRP